MLGAWMQRTGLLSHPEQHGRTLKWLAGVGLGLGLPLGLGLAYLDTLDSAQAAVFGEAIRSLGGLLTALG